MTNKSTEPQKAFEAECDNRIKKFWASLATYRQAQTSILLLQAKEEATDEEMDEAIDEQCRAIHHVLTTPIGTAHQLFDKFEVVEELIVREDAVGKSRDNYPILALASFKRDLLELNGETITF